MLKKRIIFYTDCYLFGGSEKLIFEILTSQKLSKEYDYLLIYRSSKRYKEDMCLSWPTFNYKNTKGVIFFDIHTFNLWIEERIENELFLRIVKNIEQIIYPILTPFIFLYELIFLTILFAREKADYLHIHNGGYPGALSCRAACLAAKCVGKKNILMNVNNMACDYDGPFDRLVDFLVKKIISLVVTGSKATEQELKIKRGFNDKKLNHIHHGIDSIESPHNKRCISIDITGSNYRYIIMVANFEERKGHKYAIFSFKKLLLKYPAYNDLKLILIGDGHLLSEIKDIVLKEGLTDNILFLGHKSNYLDYVASSLFLLHPSLRNEDLPYIIIEAMALGIPVIGTDVAGTSEEIENGVSGIIILPLDIDALTNAMSILLSDNEKRIEMGLAARKRYFDLFTKNRMIEDYLRLYQKLENKLNFSN